MDTPKLIYAVIKFLKKELESGGLSEDSTEGLEVGIQCLEAAYNITGYDKSLEVSCGINEIFKNHLTEHECGAEDSCNAENKVLAEAYKNEGNKYMSYENFKEAIACYTKAIQLNSKNAIYYCNRAAASNKLGNYEDAIEDCKATLKIDPKYCKAYGRMGLAFSGLQLHQEALMSYKKALEIEPDNEAYKTNLKLAESAMAGPNSNTFPPVGILHSDLSNVFSNPTLVNMASQMLANPNVQHIMNELLSGNAAQEGGNGIDVLLRASQQLAHQMENVNPDLVAEVRRQLGDDDDNPGQNAKPGTHK